MVQFSFQSKAIDKDIEGKSSRYDYKTGSLLILKRNTGKEEYSLGRETYPKCIHWILKSFKGIREILQQFHF